MQKSQNNVADARRISDGKIDAEGSYAELASNGSLQQLLAECEEEEKAQREKARDDEADDDGQHVYRSAD